MTAEEVQGKWELVVSNILEVYKDARVARMDKANSENYPYLNNVRRICARFIATLEDVV